VSAHGRILCLAILVVLAVAPGASAQDPPCSPEETSQVTMKHEVNGENAPLVATHAAVIQVDVSGFADRQSISVPPEVKVYRRTSSAISLAVPSAPSLTVSASWRQTRSDDTTCSASGSTVFPITPSRPSRTVHNKRRFFALTGLGSFLVKPNPVNPNLDPLEVSIRLTSSVRFPSANAKAYKMTVPMRTEDQIKYRKALPNLAYVTAPVKCRVFLLSCGNTISDVSRLVAGDKHARELLARTQPFREAARYGIEVQVYGASERKLRRGYDAQVRQSGKLIARLRRAESCRTVQRFGGTQVHCRAVRQSTKLN
jgi:hypothetical protein